MFTAVVFAVVFLAIIGGAALYSSLRKRMDRINADRVGYVAQDGFRYMGLDRR